MRWMLQIDGERYTILDQDSGEALHSDLTRDEAARYYMRRGVARAMLDAMHLWARFPSGERTAGPEVRVAVGAQDAAYHTRYASLDALLVATVESGPIEIDEWWRRIETEYHRLLGETEPGGTP